MLPQWGGCRPARCWCHMANGGVAVRHVVLAVDAPGSRFLLLVSWGRSLQPLRGRLGFFDLRNTTSGTFLREVRPGSELPASVSVSSNLGNKRQPGLSMTDRQPKPPAWPCERRDTPPAVETVFVVTVFRAALVRAKINCGLLTPTKSPTRSQPRLGLVVGCDDATL